MGDAEEEKDVGPDVALLPRSAATTLWSSSCLPLPCVSMISAEATAAKDAARSQQVFKRMFTESKSTSLNTSQAVKQAKLSAESENRKQKVAKVTAKGKGGKSAKPAPGAASSKKMSKGGRAKIKHGRPKKK